MSAISRNSALIKSRAYELGFDYVGISRAEFLEDEAPRLEKWLQENRHGKMSYMENHFDKRLDPRLLVPGAKSVISFIFNYFPPSSQQIDSSTLKISKYAYGKDYHWVVKDKLKQLHAFIQEEIGEVDGRGFIDSAPVLDRAWAKKSGLGWIGKNGNLLIKKYGSFFFIAELIVDLELEYDAPLSKDYCGTCRKCIDACPTEAIYEPMKVDGSKCISYLTIELKSEIPVSFAEKMDNWIFGCDVCQDVCPWNRHSRPHNTLEFQPHPDLLSLTADNWRNLKKETFNDLFRKSAVKRTKFEGLKRNIDFILDHREDTSVP